MNSTNNEEHSYENKNLLKNNNIQESNLDINNIDNKELLSNNKENKDNFLLNKKTKNDTSQIYEEEENNNNNKIKKIDDKSNKEEYDYGFSIILLEDNEEGLMEDFLKEKVIESDKSDYYNYGYTEEEFQENLHNSILYHYENHLKEEKEKRKNMQNMFMFNMNINMNMNNNIIPTSIMPQMNSFIMPNMQNNHNISEINYPIQIPPIQNNNKNNNL